jgi:TolB-like protein
MVTGRLPFESEREQAVLYSIISEPHEPVTAIRAGVPLELDRILNKALAKNPAERYQNVEDMLVDLRALRKTPLTGSGVAQPVRPARRRALIAGAGVIAASLALALGLNPGGIRDRILSGSAAPSIASIAVLPLQNLSGDPEQEYFSDGMTEALIADLAKISALKVISRTSIMRYKGTGKALRDIAKELGVDAVIEGSAQRVGDNVRITAQLIDAATDQHLWAETYDRDFADVLRLQSEVARAIAEEINVTLTPQEQTLLASGRAVNPEAHDAYLQGTFLSLRPTRPNLDTAQRYFELALEKDPNYALAHAGIAWVWLARQQLGMVPPLQAGPRVVAAAEKALALDSGLAQVHYTLALMKGWVRWDFSGAETSFRRAIELDPNYPDARVFYARLLTILKRPAEAKPQIERALELDPLNALFRAVYAQQLNFDRRYDEAITQARQALALNPDLRPAEGALTLAFLRKGMLKEAMEISIRRRTKGGDLEIAQVLQRGYDQGRYREAARDAVKLLEARSRTGTFPRGIGPYYEMADLPDKLLDFLEWAVELPDPNMPEAVRHAAQSFPELESNPRFQAILRRMGLP